MKIVYILFLISFFEFVVSQDVTVKGLFDYYINPISTRTIASIYGKCFQGIGLLTCKPVYPDDDGFLREQLPYFLTVGKTVGQNYCLSCCSSSPSDIDIWDMYCDVNEATQNQVNIYGYELRLARNMGETDQEVVRCPLRRSACAYDDLGNTLSCNRSADNTFLVGYTVTITVNVLDYNLKSWNSVSDCSIETVESNVSLAVTGEQFREKLIMIHKPPQYPSWDYPKAVFFVFFLFFVIYLLLYFCRRKRCPYCNAKLVLSRDLCTICRWVGAKPPDPVLMQALEEKGQHIQGNLPEKFPGLRLFVGLFRCLFILICCGCRRKVKVAPTKYDNVIKELESNLELVEEKIQTLDEVDKSVEKKVKKLEILTEQKI
jgi:hypothetical protein